MGVDANQGPTLLNVQQSEVVDIHWIHGNHNIQLLFQPCDAAWQARLANEPFVDVGAKFSSWSRTRAADSHQLSLQELDSQTISLSAVDPNSWAGLTLVRSQWIVLVSGSMVPPEAVR